MNKIIFFLLMLLSIAHLGPIITHKLSVLNYSVKWESGNFTPASSGWFSILCENAKEWPVSPYLWQESRSCCSVVCRVYLWRIIFIWSSTSQYPIQQLSCMLGPESKQRNEVEGVSSVSNYCEYVEEAFYLLFAWVCSNLNCKQMQFSHIGKSEPFGMAPVT